MAIFKAGTLLMLSHGAYSDYSVGATVKVLRDFDQVEVVEAHIDAFNRENPNRDWYTTPDHRSFTAWLVKEGYVEDFDCAEWHLGEYGELRPQIFPEASND